MTRPSGPSAPARYGIFLVGEEVGVEPDEAYAKVVMELSRALRSESPVFVHLTPQRRSRARAPRARSPLRGVGRMRAIANRALWSDIRRARPHTVVYVSRSSATLAGLVRSRILRWMGGRARLVMVGLQPRSLGRMGRVLCRFLWPDLLLLSTDKEVEQVRALGGRADRIVTGVDLDRFRRPRRGEKQALRRKWSVPADRRVVLHVGHLTAGRNLEALLPIAREPGFCVVMVASSQADAESAHLVEVLESAGVILIRGYLPDVDEVYRLADCYVFPTISTDYAIAMPLSVLEAMATGLPVVATRFGALGERFAGAPGVTLLDDPNRMAAAVKDILRHHVDTRRLARGYTWDAVARHVAAPDDGR